MIRSRILLAVLALTLGACGKSTIRRHGAERSVDRVVARQTGFRSRDTRCPSGIEAKVGGTFDCRFTGPGAVPYVGHVRIDAVHGERVNFFVRTEPAG